MLRRGLLYFAVVFAVGFALGTLRTLLLLPRLGERAAELIEAPFMLAAILVTGRWIARREPRLGRGALLGAGFVALALLLAVELTVVLRLRGLSVPEYVEARDPLAGAVYLGSLVVFAVVPALFGGTARPSVRRAGLADASAIARVHVATWRVGYRGIMPESVLAGLDVDECTSMWRQRVADGGDLETFAAFACEELLGFGSLSTSRDEDGAPTIGEINALYVEPGSWRRGVGGALCAALESRARERAFAELTLWVLADNARARSFYAARGYAPDGAERRETRFGGAALRKLRLRRTLESAGA